MSPASLLIGFVLLQGGVRVHTSQDAIATLPPSFDRLVPVGDLDGDGSPEVVQRSLVDFRARFDVVSVRDGRVVRVLWHPSVDWVWRQPPAWDAGKDLDGDGVADLVVGMPSHDIGADGRGALLLVSGATGEERYLALGLGDRRGMGASVVLVGDLDGDGRNDVIVGCVPPRSIEDVDRRGLVCALNGKDGTTIWEVHGRGARHELGRSLAVLDDLDCDGNQEVAVNGGPDLRYRPWLLCALDGAPTADLPYDNGIVVAAGDLDGDGTGDLVFDGRWSESRRGGWEGSVVSGAGHRPDGELILAGAWSEWGVLVALGDIDGDGFDDLASTASNYWLGENLLASLSDGRRALRDLDFEGLWGGEEDASEPVEGAGSVLVHSGRTRDVVWFLLGRPGMHEQLGHGVCAVSDVSGDGWPDLVVTGRQATYVFEGPGPDGR